jgi:hypothetical protein
LIFLIDEPAIVADDIAPTPFDLLSGHHTHVKQV